MLLLLCTVKQRLPTYSRERDESYWNDLVTWVCDIKTFNYIVSI